MDSKLSQLISEAAVIITPTQRLSRHIRYQFATEQLAQENRFGKHRIVCLGQPGVNVVLNYYLFVLNRVLSC